MSDFFRFPHTPHLAWLGQGAPREDKVLDAREVRDFLDGEVIIEEKVDGANLGLSVDSSGVIRAQNRGKYIELDVASGQWRTLPRWLAVHRSALIDVLGPNLVLFGEWCYAVHSVRYARLADWFLAFDVYDRANGQFWSVERRNRLTQTLGLAVVPELARGRFSLAAVTALLGPSRFTDGPAEGLYVRREMDGRLQRRAKVVRAEFIQAIDEHWSRRALESNQLASPQHER